MAKQTSQKGKYFEGVGRRKTAVARVRLYPDGPAQVVINDRDTDHYFKILRLKNSALAPLKVLDSSLLKKAAVRVKIKGGGDMAQAEATALGLARALVKFNQEYKQLLRVGGHLTRDARRVERKKYGLKKARRAPQWTKR
ncbi:MAG: 30S ribosomal protein S9 [Candidatus Colwellbacteria bacterium RBG_13_48_8]|uniref:Small ribosomal subunit protein uS9 n=1 Tax=Candidatus Colwellbacteria bacterium RBG_13_48_8 TaxID=1797685 RepID=A0A1G1YXM9_9BACT|nr:MAG: 30S ribosomal protein S9 [Candidatus Colwellbacteria bacterium RBG_13_48_8]